MLISYKKALTGHLRGALLNEQLFFSRMGVVALSGERRRVNHELVAYALTHTPALVIDCANVCDTHKWFALFPDADISHVYVYEMELLYKFRDALIRASDEANRRGVRTIVVTSMSHLFHYQNTVENTELYCEAWETLVSLGALFDVRVAVDTKQALWWATRYAVEVQPVGHVVSSQRQNLEQMIAEMERYASALRKDERAVFVDVLRIPLRNVGPVSSANSLHAWSFLLLSIVVEQEKRLRALEHHAGIPHRRLSSERQVSLLAQN